MSLTCETCNKPIRKDDKGYELRFGYFEKEDGELEFYAKEDAAHYHEGHSPPITGAGLGYGEKIFLFDVEVRDGENEYTYPKITLARTEREAYRKARKHARTFLGSKMKWMNKYTLEPVKGSSEHRYVTMEGVQQKTITEIITRLQW